MMVSCPKCGFTQPNDHYCANCGVNMVAFKPAEKPLAQRLISSWVFQVCVLGAVITTGYIWLSGKNTINERIADLDDPPNIRVLNEIERPVRDPLPESDGQTQASSNAAPETSVSSNHPVDSESSAPKPTTATETLARVTGPAANENLAANGNERGLLPAAENALSDSEPTGRAENEPGASPVVQRVRILFAEVQRPMVTELFSHARNLSGYSLQAAVVSDLAMRLRPEPRAETPRMRELESATEHAVRLNQPIVVFKGTRDEATAQNIGVTLEIVPLSLDDNGLTAQVEIARVLREPSSTPQLSEQTAVETVVVPKGGGAFFAVPLPRRALTEEEARLYGRTNVLRVLHSPAYQSNATEFLIFIEAL